MESLNLELEDRAIQGTVGFNTVFLWTCSTVKPKRLTTAELSFDYWVNGVSLLLITLKECRFAACKGAYNGT